MYEGEYKDDKKHGDVKYIGEREKWKEDRYIQKLKDGRWNGSGRKIFN